MKTLSTLFLASLTLLFVSCGGGAETVEAKDATETPAVVDETPAATTYTLDTDASKITWTGAKAIVDSKHTGTLKLSAGSLTLEDGNATAGSFTVDMTTLDNTDLADDADLKAKLEGHLNSPDFFDVAGNPTASFEVTSANPVETGTEYTHELTGNMTIKGIAKQITFPAKVEAVEGGVKASSTFAIDRTQWEIKYGSGSFFEGLGDKAIKNEIELTLDLTFTPAGA